MCRTITLLVAKLFFNLVVSIINKITGANRAPEGKPVRVWNVRYRSKVMEVGPAERANFWCTHSHWDSSHIVLGEDVSIYAVNEKFVTFVRTPANVKLSEAHAFYYAAQFYHATQVIEVPIAEFHRLAATLGDPKGELVFLYSTGRCGSTLLQQMMSAFPNTVSLSEPDSFTHIHILKNKDVPALELKLILQSVIRMECKNLKKGEMLVLKTRSQCTWQGALVTELFPTAHLLFMYRNAIDVTFSNLRAFMHLPGVSLSFNERVPLAIRGVLTMPLKNFLAKSAAHLYTKEYLANLTPMALTGTGWVVECHSYNQLREKGVRIRAVRYENLLSDAQGFIGALAKYLSVNLTPDMTQKSLDAMKKDSQENSAVGAASQTKLVFTDKDRQVLVDVLAHKNMTADMILEGTLVSAGN